MERRVSAETRKQILLALRGRYRQADRREKRHILNQLVAITGYHRKHAIRLLADKDRIGDDSNVRAVPPRIYDEAVLEALIVVWEAADRICSKRLKVVMPSFIGSMERHGYLRLDPELREKLLGMSVATIDRLLRPVRVKAKGRRKRRRPPSAALKALIPVHTFADWAGEPPGFCEADLVAHNGGESAGRYVHTLVVTDVATGWTECLALVCRQGALVVEALEVVAAQFPFPLLGLDFDNDGVFMNDGVVTFCQTRGIRLTRSRVYRKNDQAWIEQKNGAVVRRFTGYARFSGIVAAHTLGRLYQLVRLYVNFFQPSFKLQSKVRQGARVTKTYLQPATPCDRALASDHVPG